MFEYNFASTISPLSNMRIAWQKEGLPDTTHRRPEDRETEGFDEQVKRRRV
jgi:hypothetical protein